MPLAPANLADCPEAGEDVGTIKGDDMNNRNADISTTSSEGIEGAESLSRKCCDVLHLGEKDGWIETLESGDTDAPGDTPAQRCGTTDWYTAALIRMGGDGQPWWFAEIDALRDRVAVLEAECLAGRNILQRDVMATPTEYVRNLLPRFHAEYHAARAATGQIGGGE